MNIIVLQDDKKSQIPKLIVGLPVQLVHMKPCDMPNYMLLVDCAGMNCSCSTQKTICPKLIHLRMEVDLPDEQTVH